MKRANSKSVLVCTRLDFVTWFQSSQCSTMMDFEAPPVLGRKDLALGCAFGPFNQDHYAWTWRKKIHKTDKTNWIITDHVMSHELLCNALMRADFETQEVQVNQCLKRSCYAVSYTCDIVKLLNASGAPLHGAVVLCKLRCPPNCQGWRWRVAAMILRTNLSGIPALADDKHPLFYRWSLETF